MLETIFKYIPLQDLMWIAIAIPLAGFLLNGLIFLYSSFKKDAEPRGLVSLIGVLAPLLSLSIVVVIWYVLRGLEGATPSIISDVIGSWKGFLGQKIEFGLKADPLSLSLGFVITLVFAFGNLYSIGYFAKEKTMSTYYATMNLILALALTLVFTDSIFLFFVIYQMFGVVAFIFIARLSSKGEAAPVASIYFVMQLIAAAAFLFVMFLIWKTYLSTGYKLDVFKFESLAIVAPYLVEYAHLISAVLIGVAVVGSMQFPFYLWLPNISRSPLPPFLSVFAVSSMLVSIYLLVRLNFILILSSEVLSVVAYLGAAAALLGALSAISQKGAKKMISYLVISNMGMAFMAIGVGAFSTAVFHVFAYAISVASIFFGIGSVVSVCGSDALGSVRGLRKILPVTFWTTLFGALSFIGIYPFAGFYSKNGVLWEVYQRGFGLIFMLGFLAMMIGAVAVFRMIALMFYGKMDRSKLPDTKIEESSVSMLVVQLIFAFASLVTGWFSVSAAFGGEDTFRSWLGEGLVTQMMHVAGDKGKFSELVIAVVVTLFVAHAALLTWIVFVQKRRWVISLTEKFPKTYTLLDNGFYINKIYSALFVKPLGWFADNVVSKGLDETFFGGVVFGSPSRFAGLLTDVISRIKRVNAYVLVMLLMAVLIAMLFVVVL